MVKGNKSQVSRMRSKMLGRTELPAWIAVVGREGILSRLGFRPHLIRKGASARRGLRGGGVSRALGIFYPMGALYT